MAPKQRLGILALVILIPALLWVRYQDQIDDTGLLAYTELERIFAGGQLSEEQADEGDLIRTLLTHESQWDHLYQLDAQFQTLAFYPDRSQVYFLHKRQGEESGKSCIGVVTVRKGGMENHTAHSGFPLYLQLTSMNRIGDTLSISGKIRPDANHPRMVNGTEVSEGLELEFEIHTDRFQNATISVEDLGPPILP